MGAGSRVENHEHLFFFARLTEDSQGVLVVWESTRCPSVPTDMHLSTLSKILSSEDDSFCIIHITSIDGGGGGGGGGGQIIVFGYNRIRT